MFSLVNVKFLFYELVSCSLSFLLNNEPSFLSLIVLSINLFVYDYTEKMYC